MGNDLLASSPYFNAYKLAVDGMIISKRSKGSAGQWADYVLKEDYDMMTLPEVNDFILKYGHLPGMPSEKEVLENGIDLGEMAGLQQVKIEELTKYIIQLEKRINEMELKTKR